MKLIHNRNSILFKRWSQMRARCNCRSHSVFEYSGGRGVVICEEWDIFENFEKWALDNGFQDDLFIKRIDMYGDYEPSNCKIINKHECYQNKKPRILIEYKNKKMGFEELSKLTNISSWTLRNRHRRGLTGDKLFKSKHCA